MPTIKELRQLDPSFADYSDNELAQAFSAAGFDVEVPKQGVGSRLYNVGVDAVQGVGHAAEGIVGLAGMIPGVHYAADPLGRAINQGTKWVGDTLHTDPWLEEERQMRQAISDAGQAGGWEGNLEGAKEAFSQLYQNPWQAVGTAASSIPQMIAGGYLAKGVQGAGRALGLTKGLSPGVAAAIGEGGIAGGSVASSIAQNPGSEFGDRYWGVPAGVATGLISRGAAKVMPLGREGLDIDEAIAARMVGSGPVNAERTLAAMTPTNLLSAMPKSVFREGVLEEGLQSPSEAMFENIGTGRPWEQGLGASAAEGVVTGGLFGIPGGYRGIRNEISRRELANDLQPYMVDPTKQTPTDLLQALENRDVYNYAEQFRDPATQIDNLYDYAERQRAAHEASMASQAAQRTEDLVTAQNSMVGRLQGLMAERGISNAPFQLEPGSQTYGPTPAVAESVPVSDSSGQGNLFDPIHGYPMASSNAPVVQPSNNTYTPDSELPLVGVAAERQSGRAQPIFTGEQPTPNPKARVYAGDPAPNDPAAAYRRAKEIYEGQKRQYNIVAAKQASGALLTPYEASILQTAPTAPADPAFKRKKVPVEKSTQRESANAKQLLRKRIDAASLDGELTPEQHAELVSELESGRDGAKVESQLIDHIDAFYESKLPYAYGIGSREEQLLPMAHRLRNLAYHVGQDGAVTLTKEELTRFPPASLRVVKKSAPSGTALVLTKNDNGPLGKDTGKPIPVEDTSKKPTIDKLGNKVYPPLLDDNGNVVFKTKRVSGAADAPEAFDVVGVRLPTGKVVGKAPLDRTPALEKIQQNMANASEQERKVVEAVIRGEQTHEDIGKLFGVSKGTVSNILNKFGLSESRINDMVPAAAVTDSVAMEDLVGRGNDVSTTGFRVTEKAEDATRDMSFEEKARYILGKDGKVTSKVGRDAGLEEATDKFLDESRPATLDERVNATGNETAAIVDEYRAEAAQQKELDRQAKAAEEEARIRKRVEAAATHRALLEAADESDMLERNSLETLTEEHGITQVEHVQEEWDYFVHIKMKDEGVEIPPLDMLSTEQQSAAIRAMMYWRTRDGLDISDLHTAFGKVYDAYDNGTSNGRETLDATEMAEGSDYEGSPATESRGGPSAQSTETVRDGEAVQQRREQDSQSEVVGAGETAPNTDLNRLEPGRRGFIKAMLGLVAGYALPQSKAMAADFKGALWKGDIAAALGIVATGSANPAFRLLAKKLQKLGTTGIALHVIEIGKEYKSGIPASLANGAVGTARINREAKTIDVFLRGDVGVDEETFLHEMIHAALMSRYDQLNYYLANKKLQGKNADAALDLYKQVRREFEAEFNKAFPERSKAPIELQAALDPDEFITYAMTNPVVQNWMQGRKYNGTTLWGRFKEFVKGVLGFGGTSPTWLDAALRVGNDVLDAAAMDTPDFKPSTELLRITGKKTGSANRVMPHPVVAALNNDHVQSSLATAKDWTKKYGMQFMFLHHIERMYKDSPLGKLVTKYYKSVKAVASKSKLYLEEGRPILETWMKLDGKMQQALTDAINAGTVEQAYGDVDFNHTDNEHLWKDKTPDELAENRMAWERSRDAYAKIKNDPVASKNYRAIYNLTKRWMKQEYELRGRAARDIFLPEVETALKDPALYAQVVKQYQDITVGMTEAKRAVRKLIGKNDAALAAIRKMDAAIDDQIGRLHEMQGPYFPLMRFGDHVMVFESNAFNAARQAVIDNRKAVHDFRLTDPAMKKVDDELQELRRLTTDELQLARAGKDVTAIKAAVADQRKVVKDAKKAAEASKANLAKLRAASAAATKSLSAMSSDPKHFVFEKHATRGAALKAAKMYGPEAKAFIAQEYIQGFSQPSKAFINKLEEKLKESLPESLQPTAKSAIQKLFVDTASENSTLKRLFNKRKNVAGYDKDGMRVFSSFLMQGAHRLANIEHFVDMQESLDNLRKETGAKDRGESGTDARMSNELAQRYALDLDYTETPFQNRIAAFNHVWTLGITPAYLLQNVLQTPMMALPMIYAKSGKGGITKAVEALWSSFSTAKKLLGEAMKRDGLRNYTLDLDKATGITDNERAMLKDLFGRGLIDILAEHDVGEIASGSTAWRKVAGVMDTVNWTARQIEVMNRLTTALAAYRVTGDIDATATIVADSQVDYSNDNAPRWFKSNAFLGAKLLTQFKKYQFAMAYTVASNAKDAFKGDKEAQRTIGGMMVTSFLMAGTMGLPIYGPMLFIASMLMPGDDDDWEREYKNFLSSMGPVGDAIGRGLPTAFGADIHKNVGMGSLFNPLPYLRTEKEGKAQYDEFWMAVMPPAIGTGRRIADGVDSFSQGKLIDGASKVAPRWVAGTFKAIKLNEEGITDKNGNVHFGPEKFDAADKVMQAMGIPLLETSKYYERVGDFYKLKGERDKDRESIIDRWIKGENVEDDRREFNAKYPDATITYKDKMTRAKSRQAYAKSVDEGGLRTTKKDQSIRSQIAY